MNALGRIDNKQLAKDKAALSRKIQATAAAQKRNAAEAKAIQKDIDAYKQELKEESQ